MSGYNYKKGMYNKADKAFEEEKLTKSMIKGKHLKNAGINETLINVKNAIKDGRIVPCGWYKTGGYWNNAVDYFDLDDVKRQIEQQGGLSHHYSNSSESLQEYQVEGYWIDWSGSPSKPRNKGRKYFTGTLKPNGWIYLDSGRKKDSNGNSIFYEIIK